MRVRLDVKNGGLNTWNTVFQVKKREFWRIVKQLRKKVNRDTYAYGEQILVVNSPTETLTI